MKKNLMGPYGQWASERYNQSPGKLSFRQKQFKSLSAWRKKALAKTRELMAIQDLKWKPRVNVGSTYEFDGLHVEELTWQLPYGRPTEAVFVKPAGVKGKLPGILGLHCHGGNKYFGKRKIIYVGKRHPRMIEHHKHYYSGNGWATELAKKGYGVLVHDGFLFGSRRVRYGDVPGVITGNKKERNPESAREIDLYNAWAREHEHIMAKSLFCAGITWPGMYFNEDQCALDVLCARKDVDPKRVGCGGLSGGGLRTVFLAGLDPRIQVAVCVGFMSTWNDVLLNKSYTHTWMTEVPLLPQYLNFPEILGLRLPRPTLVLNTRQDQLYTLKGMKDAADILTSIYKKAKAPDSFRCSFYNGGHQFNAAMQKEAFAWFDQWLK